jgi:hypothetical protein
MTEDRAHRNVEDQAVGPPVDVPLSSTTAVNSSSQNMWRSSPTPDRRPAVRDVNPGGICPAEACATPARSQPSPVATLVPGIYVVGEAGEDDHVKVHAKPARLRCWMIEG